MADEGTPGGMKAVTDMVPRHEIDDAVTKAMSNRDVKEIKDGLVGLGEKFDKFLVTLAENYVTKTEFNPVKNIVYSAVAIILSSFVLALFYLVAHNSK